MSQPIFILGTGRCGSTLLHSLVARHPLLSWFTNVERRFRSPTIGILALRLLRLPRFAALNWSRRPKGLIRPVEVYDPLERAFPGFSEPRSDLETGDVTVAARETLPRLLGRLAARVPDGRALLKWTGWSRVGFMDELFSDALFVHVHRDGRAVAASLVRQPWWSAGTPQEWRWGPVPPEVEGPWREGRASPVVLAGIQWRNTFQGAEAALGRVSERRVFRVSFERLLEEPVRIVREIHAWAGLAPPADLERLVPAGVVDRRALGRWRSRLEPEEIRVLDSLLAEDLELRRTLPEGAVG